MASVALMSTSGPDERPRVLIVDDEKFIRDILADFLGMEGYIVRTAEDGAAALTELHNAHYDLVISDLKMPRMGGIELLDAIGTAAPNALTVIMTGFGTVETAIDAMKRGAYDYILKPFKVEEVIHVVQRGLEKQRLAAENLRLREALSLYKVSEAIAASLSLEEVLATVGDTAVHELERRPRLDVARRRRGRLLRAAAHRAAAGERDLAHSDRPHRDATDSPTRGAQRRASAASSRRARSSTTSRRTRRSSSRARKGAALLRDGRRRRRSMSLVVGAAAHEDAPARLDRASRASPSSKRFDEGQRKLLVDRRLARGRGDRERAPLRGPARHLPADHPGPGARPSTRWTATPRATPSASPSTPRTSPSACGLPTDVVEIVRQSALMHDIGKIGCVMNLNKPGKLTQDEYEIFKKHPAYGKDILDPIKFLHPLIPGVHLHHERWDGRGYPLGLKGNDVPLIARIIAVADTYDAMTSDRAYRRALPHEVAVAEIERCCGIAVRPRGRLLVLRRARRIPGRTGRQGDQSPGLRRSSQGEVTALYSAMLDDKLRECLTFDDVLLVPAYSDVLPKDVDVKTRLCRGASSSTSRSLSAAMDSVTESRDRHHDGARGRHRHPPQEPADRRRRRARSSA